MSEPRKRGKQRAELTSAVVGFRLTEKLWNALQEAVGRGYAADRADYSRGALITRLRKDGLLK